MTPAIMVQLLIGAVPIAVAFFAYQSATRANRITAEATERNAMRSAELERTKVDAEAYDRAKNIYEAALEQLRRQLERVQSQFDREQDIGDGLRNQVFTSQQRILTLERTVAELRNQLVTAGIPPAAGPDLPPPGGE
jgi:chromosome segregation ATPase